PTRALHSFPTRRSSDLIGIPLLLSMRGTLGELNPSQVPMGRATVGLLAALGIPAYSVSAPERAGPAMAGVLASAFSAGTTSAVRSEEHTSELQSQSNLV